MIVLLDYFSTWMNHQWSSSHLSSSFCIYSCSACLNPGVSIYTRVWNLGESKHQPLTPQLHFSSYRAHVKIERASLRHWHPREQVRQLLRFFLYVCRRKQVLSNGWVRAIQCAYAYCSSDWKSPRRFNHCKFFKLYSPTLTPNDEQIRLFFNGKMLLSLRIAPLVLLL